MISSLACDFVINTEDRERLEAVRLRPFNAFRIDRCVGTRPSVLQKVLKIDDEFLRRTERTIQASALAAKRLGADWLPQNGTKIETKATNDDTWVTADDMRPLNDVCTKWCSKTFSLTFSRTNMVAM